MLEVLVEKARKRSGPIIVVMHEPLVGCHSDDGYPINKRNQIKIEDGEFDVDYWALGDMHRVQQLFAKCFYCGAPHQTRFGEHEEKGVLLVDTDNPADPEFIIFEETTPLVTLDSVPTQWPDAFVRLTTAEAITEALPDNVEYQSIVLNVSRTVDRGEVIGVLDGLNEQLQRAGLRPDLQDLATKLAEKMLLEVQ
jgi:DNA repair exonuclease SbcCD nuclease subunit